jgi:hypothetical protein
VEKSLTISLMNTKTSSAATTTVQLGCCIHQCTKCGVLYHCGNNDNVSAKCEMRFHLGKCVVCKKVFGSYWL